MYSFFLFAGIGNTSFKKGSTEEIIDFPRFLLHTSIVKGDYNEKERDVKNKSHYQVVSLIEPDLEMVTGILYGRLLHDFT